MENHENSLSDHQAGAPSYVEKPKFDEAQIIKQLTTSWQGAGKGYIHKWPNEQVYYYLGLPVLYPDAAYDKFAVEMTPAMKEAARAAFALWDDLIPISILESASNSQHQIQVEHATETWNSHDENYEGGTYTTPKLKITGEYFQSIERQEIWITNKWETNRDERYLNYNGYGFETYVHEIGHALGLSHPGDYNADHNQHTYEKDAVYDRDTRRFTVMSYFGYYDIKSGWNHGKTNNSGLYATTPMVDDISAIQHLYGKDMNTRTEDNIYGFGNNTGNNIYSFDHKLNPHPIFTIWDAGGVDTIDASQYDDNQIIDLVDGNYSSIGGMKHNIAIARTAIVENATGGSRNDHIIGNAIDNILIALDGVDTVHGGDGNDFSSGGFGDDEIHGEEGNDQLFGDDDNDLVDGGNGNDLAYGGTGNDTVFGSTGTDQVYGQDGDDFVGAGDGQDFGSGGFGNDEVHGEGGNDLLFGDDGNDGVYGEDGDDRVYGGTGNDYLTGDAGNDQIFGEDGDDFVGAGAGHDFGSGGWGNDEVHGEGGNDLLFGDDGNDGVYGEDGDDRVYGGTGNDYLTGDAGNDQIFGEADGDGLSGGAGNDTLDGGAGADLLFGNAGDDVLTGGAGADVFAFGAGDGLDRILDFITDGSEADVIAFSGGTFADFTAVQAASRQEGADVMIFYSAGDNVTLMGVQLSTMSATNFTFA